MNNTPRWSCSCEDLFFAVDVGKRERSILRESCLLSAKWHHAVRCCCDRMGQTADGTLTIVHTEASEALNMQLDVYSSYVQ